MVRNKVQFQKGVSLNDFIKQYGTEAQCFDALYAWRWPKGFQGIYLITQDKKGISDMKLHRHLGISYNAAWRMKHKLMQVMMERDHNNKLSGLIELDDAYLGGERTGCKPGRGAAGKMPFVAAVETTAEHCPIRVKLSVVKGFRTEAIKS